MCCILMGKRSTDSIILYFTGNTVKKLYYRNRYKLFVEYNHLWNTCEST